MREFLISYKYTVTEEDCECIRAHTEAEAWDKFNDLIDKREIHPELDDLDISDESIVEITEPDPD